MNVNIPFTQYLRPDGRKALVTIDRPAEIAQLAVELIFDDWQFEVEELITGEVIFEICKEVDGETVSLSTELVPNGPEVPSSVDRLIKNASKRLKLWKTQN